MSCERNLILAERELSAADEWTATARGWCIVRLSSGMGYCLHATGLNELAVGTVVIVPPGESAIFRASQLGRARFHYFYFQPELLGGVLTLEERHVLTRAATAAAGRLRQLPPTHPLAGQFSGLWETTPSASRMLERCQLLLLAARLFAPEVSPRGEPTPDRPGSGRKFTELMENLSESDVADHTPRELARLCGCSARHFTRLFHAHFGVSPGEKLKQLRLEKARLKLCETDAALTDVAREAGYQNRVAFSHSFKRHFGVSPAELRSASVPGHGNVKSTTRS